MKKLMSVNETAKVFGIGRDKLYALIRSQSDIPIVKIGDYKKINVDLFDKWLDKCTAEGREL